jgi:hypothetical protein
MPVAKELRRIKAVEDAAKFENFVAHHKPKVWDEV